MVYTPIPETIIFNMDHFYAKHEKKLKKIFEENSFDLIALDFEWTVGRYEQLIDLVQLAIPTKVILLRTNVKAKLPKCVWEILNDESITKVISSVFHANAPDFTNFYQTFDYELFSAPGLTTLSEIGEELGHAKCGIEALAKHFNFPHKKKYLIKFDWSQYHLSKKQINYAATDAWLTLLIMQELRTEKKLRIDQLEG